MESKDDFIQKFNYSQSDKKSGIGTTILTSVISAIIGGACAVGIYAGVTKASISKPASNTELSASSSSKYENLNLAQVSLKNYSDTAVYAANKVLPSMVSISVEYDITYMGRTRFNNRFWFWYYNQ